MSTSDEGLRLIGDLVAEKDATIASLEEQATLSVAKIARLEAEKASLSAALDKAEEALKIWHESFPDMMGDEDYAALAAIARATGAANAVSIASAKAGEVGG